MSPVPERVLIAQARGTAIILAYKPAEGFVAHEVDAVGSWVEEAIPDLMRRLDQLGDGLFYWEGHGRIKRYAGIDGIDYDVWTEDVVPVRPATVAEVRHFFPQMPIAQGA